MKHWLENAVPAIPPNTIIALLDPDMIFVRPLGPQIRGDISLLTDRGIKDDEIVDVIGLGHPVSQTYGLGAPWTNDNHKKFNRGKICGEGSPCLQVNMRYGELHYSVGPPYIAHRSDFIRIVESWTTFVPRYIKMHVLCSFQLNLFPPFFPNWFIRSIKLTYLFLYI